MDVKDILANLNGTTDERRREAINEAISVEIGTSEELCVHRLMIKEIVSIIKTLHSGEIDTSRFDALDAAIEAIIAEKNKIYGKEKDDEEDL